MGMTKTEYAEYLASDHWRELRKEFLLECGDCCNRCSLPRWLANIIYDQDLHAHHKHYRSLGKEDFSDLEALCRRCHEIETFGRSGLRQVKQILCPECGGTHFDQYHPSDLCQVCARAFETPFWFWAVLKHAREVPDPTRQLTSNLEYFLSIMLDECGEDDILDGLISVNEKRRLRRKDF